MNKIIVIVGAGPAGLSAAYQILKDGVSVPIIVEKDSQVVGISKTVNYDGNKANRNVSKNLFLITRDDK